jgi:hypothetical protein
MATPTREEINAEIAAAEARTDTKIVRLEGKIDLVISKLDAANTINAAIRQEVRDSGRAVIANAWVIFAAMVGIVAIVATVGPMIFDLGIRTREANTKDIQERLPTLPPTGPARSLLNAGAVDARIASPRARGDRFGPRLCALFSLSCV